MSESARRSWSFNSHVELAAVAQSGTASELNIIRLAPGDGHVVFDWAYEGTAARAKELNFYVDIRLHGDEGEFSTGVIDPIRRQVKIEGLENGKDYELQLKAATRGRDGDIAAQSPARLVRPGVVPGTVINYIHPEDYTYNFSGRSPASPSIVELPDGRLVASHDVYWGKGGQNLSKVFRSDDGGQTWSFLCDLYPCFWGKLFFHRGCLYMLATSTEYGDLLIGRSEDGGATWSAPTKLIEGGSREQGGPHKAPMPVTVHKGRLWSAVEYGSWGLGGHATGVVSAPEDADLLDPANWAATPFLPYDSRWPGTIEGGDKPGLLEGNIAVTPDGRLINLLRYNTRGGKPDYGRAIMLNVNDKEPGAPLTFGKVIDFHGNMSKFTIHYDGESGKYWSLVNRVNSSNITQRNILTLVSSADLEHWTIHRDILNYEENGWPEDNTKVGFQYVDWLFHGNDILVVSRTAINGAHNYHNANYITFHTIASFRE